MSDRFSQLSNEELRQELIKYGVSCGPIGTTTRNVYEKRLQKKLAEVGKKPSVSDMIPSHEKSTNGHNSTLSTSGSSSKSQPPPQQPFPSSRSPLQIFGDSNSKTFSDSIFDRPISKSTSITSTTVRTKFPEYKRDSFDRSTFSDKSAGSSFLRHGLDEEDDHTESSRIISPKNRYKGRYSGNFKEKNVSSIDKLKNMGNSAWGFFSRSTGTSTPCSDLNYKNKYTTNKYRRSSYSNNFTYDGSKNISDYSYWIRLLLIAFFIGIFATYLYTMHSGVVYNTLMAGTDFIYMFFSYTFFPLICIFIVFVICLGLYKLFQHKNYRKIEHKQSLIRLVERITDIIYDSGISGVAEPHVRDMLMPPTKRSNEDYILWLEAARFINNEDSRVRTEIRLINGTECNVWIWIGAGKQRWQGTAVAESSLSSRVPDSALSCCLKLRGLNFSDNKIECDGLKKELLAKLPVVPRHVEFLKNPVNHESIVYLMLKDLIDAKKAFSSLHSQWFDGSIITVKYIKDERYAERFPGLE